MAKIPRIRQGDLPSAVPAGRSALDPALVAAPFAAAGDVAETYQKQEATSAVAEMEAYKKALAEKQAIVDEVHAGKLTTDFEMDGRDSLADFQARFFNDPQSAREPFVDTLRRKLDSDVQNAPNPAVAMQLARAGTSRISSLAAEMDGWALARTTQQTKTFLDDDLNTTAAAQENAVSVYQVQANLEAKKLEIAPRLLKALGPAEAEKKWRETEKNAYEGWAYVHGATEGAPQVLSALDDTKSRMAQVFTPKERDQLRTHVTNSIGRIEETNRINDLKSLVGGNAELWKAFNADKYSPGLYLSDRRKYQANLDLIDAKEKSGQITKEQATKERAVPDGKIRFLNALDTLWSSAHPQAIEDDMAARAALVVSQKKIKQSKSSVTLETIAKQQEAIIQAAADRKITGGTARTLLGELDVLFPSSAMRTESQTSHWGLTWSWPFVRESDLREMGQKEIDKQWSKAYSGYPRDVLDRVTLKYTEMMNQKAATTPEEAVAYAREAIFTITNEAVKQ